MPNNIHHVQIALEARLDVVLQSDLDVQQKAQQTKPKHCKSACSMVRKTKTI